MNLREHLPLAKAVADRFVRQWGWSISPDDIRQAALIGLWEALQKHDGSPHFAAFARLCIKHRIIGEIRSHSWGNKRTYVGAAQFPELGPGAEDNLPDRRPSPEAAAIAAHDVGKALGALPERSRAMVAAHAHSYRMHEIGDAHGVSGPRVSQIIGESLTTMRAHLERGETL